MGDSKQGNGQYNQWTLQESKMLLGLLVEGIKHGWRDASGAISKQTVETKILPILNEKLGCQKTYKHYQNRMKWFKNQYQTFADLLRYSSGFGWDAVSKKFTADNEIWEDYFKVIFYLCLILFYIDKLHLHNINNIFVVLIFNSPTQT